MILVTGGCGFIGSNFVLEWFAHHNEQIVVFDNLTYAGNLDNLKNISDQKNFTFIKGDINDTVLLNHLFNNYKPRAILNFAAETHVDRSIHSPDLFIRTNVNGTFALLETSRKYWMELSSTKKNNFRFLQISTDEVYGSLNPSEPAFTEESKYQPNNPYSASKAAGDHLVKAYYHTYGLPTLITNCSNNYGPYQFPEKLIPFMLTNAIQNQPLLIYGDGLQIRDWLFVSDHCRALRLVLEKGDVGETYNIGGNNEVTNLEVVRTICYILNEMKPQTKCYSHLITHIKDRPGHDRRYAINANKMKTELGWTPHENFVSGLKKTIQWYLLNDAWLKSVSQNQSFSNWMETQYQEKELI